MNHNNTDDDKINNDTSNKEQSLEETSKSLDNEDDFFTSNAPQKTTHESRSYLILILIKLTYHLFK